MESRINIYVTAALRKEMADRPNINWSKIARAAFEAEITRLDKEEKHRVAEVVEPLLCL